MNRLRTALRSSGRGVTALAVSALTISGLAMVATAAPAAAVTNAVSTTTNTAYSGEDAGNGACLHGNTAGDVVNCNHYADKRDVWLSNLPSKLAAGTYFFAVLAPGGQQDPNDGTPGNLSDDFDVATNRSFTQAGGQVTTTSGTHHVSGGKIQLWNFADTPNPGGVYILAVCAGDGTTSVDPSSCKYDAFKVDLTEEPPPCEEPSISSFTTSEYDEECPPEVTELDPLTVYKDAAGTYDNTYTWDVEKVQNGKPTWSGTTASVPYKVTVTPDAGTKTNYDVTGTITVFNPNKVPVSGVTATDQLTITHADTTIDHFDCDVTGGAGIEAAPGETKLAYTCDLEDPLAEGDTVDNNAKVEWEDNIPAPTFPYFLGAGSAYYTFPMVKFAGNDIDECVELKDIFQGGTATVLDGSICVGDPAADFVKTFSKNVTVETCEDVTNVAKIVANDTGAYSSDSVTSRVCRGPEGAHTMGFWQNKNGQSVITDQAKTGVCPSAVYLRTLKPFQDLSATATCAATAKYVTDVIKAASAGGAAMNAMLKGQMLATALSVYYTGPAGYATSKKFLPGPPIGTAAVDLLHPKDVSAAFNGRSWATVNELLQMASDKFVSATSWYSQIKATQEKAKNTFDAINNNVALAP